MTDDNDGSVEPSLHEDLRAVLNKHSVENGSNTPDTILASYLIDCLKIWNVSTNRRDRFFNGKVGPDA